MPLVLLTVNEPDPDLRTLVFQLVLADGLTPALGEAGGQPQISVNDGSGWSAWTNTGIGTLSAIGHGRYDATLDVSILSTVGTRVESRYASVNTAECPGDSAVVVAAATTPGGGGGGTTQVTTGNAELTIRTSQQPYSTPAELLKRLDLRTVGDLCSDNGTRVLATALPTDPNLHAALIDASAILEQYATRGGVYSPADLAALAALPDTDPGSGNPYGVASGALKRFMVRLVTVMLFERRPDMELKQPWIWEQVEKDLTALADGKEIFSFLQTQDAGRQSHEVETARIIQKREGIVVNSMSRFWGRQNNQRDPRRQ